MWTGLGGGGVLIAPQCLQKGSQAWNQLGLAFYMFAYPLVQRRPVLCETGCLLGRVASKTQGK